MSFTDNALIARLEKDDRTRFLDLCERVLLSRATCLCQPGESIDHVYFPVEGFVCLLAHEPDAAELIIAKACSIRARHWASRRHRCEPRCRARAGLGGCPPRFSQQQLVTSAALKRLMDRYVAVVLNQSATLALCLRYHEVGARLARWLLMSQDRTGSNRCQVTHAR